MLSIKLCRAATVCGFALAFLLACGSQSINSISIVLDSAVVDDVLVSASADHWKIATGWKRPHGCRFLFPFLLPPLFLSHSSLSTACGSIRMVSMNRANDDITVPSDAPSNYIATGNVYWFSAALIHTLAHMSRAPCAMARWRHRSLTASQRQTHTVTSARTRRYTKFDADSRLSTDSFVHRLWRRKNTKYLFSTKNCTSNWLKCFRKCFSLSLSFKLSNSRYSGIFFAFFFSILGTHSSIAPARTQLSQCTITNVVQY